MEQGGRNAFPPRDGLSAVVNPTTGEQPEMVGNVENPAQYEEPQLCRGAVLYNL